jgi:class 3 adenylate cyclase
MSAIRRLAAILAADVAGYSRLMGADEEGTHERLKALRHELLDPKIAEHRGRIVKTTGDGLLVEFGSVVDAVRCAVEVLRRCPSGTLVSGRTTASNCASGSISTM